MNGCHDACRVIYDLATQIVNDPETLQMADGAAMKRIRASCVEIQRNCQWMQRNCFFETEAGGLPGDDLR